MVFAMPINSRTAVADDLWRSLGRTFQLDC
jgi:hypothetical protein